MNVFSACVCNQERLPKKKKVKLKRESTRELKKAMSCCTGCRVKFSLLNPENGCSNCAFAFCKKCTTQKFVIPALSNKPVSVCQNCYRILTEKIEGNSKITSTPLPAKQAPQSSPSSSTSSNWWGEGQPPPSFRHQSNVPAPNLRLIQQRRDEAKYRGIAAEKTAHRHEEARIREEADEKTRELERKLAAIRQQPNPEDLPSVEEMEERLAALRGCDVELIRNPRKWFESSSKRPDATPKDLLAEATERAQIETEHDPDDALQRRLNVLVDKDPDAKDPEEEQREKDKAETAKFLKSVQSSSHDPNRLSVAPSVTSEMSSDTLMSESTVQEMKEIEALMKDAEAKTRLAEAGVRPTDEEMKKETREIMKATRQKSLEAEKIQLEMGKFWDRRLGVDPDADLDDEEGDEISDEAVEKIIRDVEATVKESRREVPVEATPTSPAKDESPSKKKPNFISKLFKR